jgi:hypothetical protein
LLVLFGRRTCGIASLAFFLAMGSDAARAQDQASAPNQNQSQQPSPTQPNQTQPNQDHQNDPTAPQPPQQTPPQPPSQQQPAPQQPQPPAGLPDSPQPSNPNPAAVVAQATKKLGEQTLGRVRDWETEWLIGAYVGRNRPLVPLTREGREDLYLHQTFLTPGAYFIRLFDAGVDQVRGSPSQWGGGIGGYATRFASREGQFFASTSLTALGNAKLRYEPRYDQCKCEGFWHRAKHAIKRNFVTYNETEKEMRPQWALYGGAFAGGMIASTWKPSTHGAFTQGGIAALEEIGFGSLENFFIEFGVDINRKLGAKPQP